MRRAEKLKKGVLFLGVVITAVTIVFVGIPYLFKLIFYIKEPTFIPPISLKADVSGIGIRTDAMGDGHFGARRSNGARMHKGLDITAPLEEPVVASKSGWAEKGEVFYGMGKYVKISHPDGYITIYGHLKSVYIPYKKWVWQGERIGGVGKSGNARHRYIKPHLHFEIRKGHQVIDPTPYVMVIRENK
jgi:murein DD-endopeptidase MepM/ murein hydrolase activator NlpD